MGIVRKNIFLLYHPMFASRFKQGLWPLSRGLNRPITFYTKAPAFSRFPARSYATYRRFDGSNGYGYSYYNWNKLLYNKNTIYIGIGLIGFYIYNLHEAPFTKRLRFIWTPYWLEKMIGDYSYYQLTAEFANQIIPDSNPIYSKISTIMNKLLTAAISGIDDEKQKKYLQSLDWKIHVIQTDADQPPNAFILPNGKIFIFSTILPICQNDDGLATVLSHELSHQIAHHSGEQISKNPIYILLAIALYTITQSSSLNELIIGSLLKLPASREMESEADHIGCELLAKLCFNLNEAVNFWNRMDQFENKMKGTLDTSRIEEFFSTHPATATRIADIKSWLPGLEHMKEQSGCYEYQFGHFRNATKDYFSRA